MKLSNWMGQIPDNTNIKKINIPGAHDSCAQFCSFSLFSRCQSLSVKEMLNIGVRAFDLRVNGEIMVHSFIKCRCSPFGKALTIHEICDDILSFLSNNPTETVLFIFKNDGKISGEVCVKTLKNIINKNPEKWYLINRFPLLSEVRGKIILINRVDDSIGVNFSNMPYQGNTKNFSFETFSINEKDSVLVQDFYTLTRKGKWLKAIVPVFENDFPEQFIFNNLSTAGLPLIPKYNAAYINNKFLKCVFKKYKSYGTLMLDFINEPLCEKIITSNSNKT